MINRSKMKKHRKVWTCLFCILLLLSASSLSAQGKKDKKVQVADNSEVSLSDSCKTVTDSLLRVVDSLRKTLEMREQQNGKLQLALHSSEAKADSLKNVADSYLTFVLNYGNSLLYRKYSARAEDIATLLAAAPDDLKQKDWESMLALAKTMIQSSDVTEDMRTHVFHLLESVPRNEQYANDIREVLQNVPPEVQSRYSLSRQAVSLIDAMPKTVTDSDDRFSIVRGLLLEYKTANEEIKKVLRDIQNHPDNSINISDAWPGFERQIKNTAYYKRYYGAAWSIPYLNSIIDQALSRLHGATKRVDFDDLIGNL